MAINVYHEQTASFENILQLVSTETSAVIANQTLSASVLSDDNEQVCLNSQQQQEQQQQQEEEGNEQSSMDVPLNIYCNLVGKMKVYFCCVVCLDMPQIIIYQCTNGHLMCDGCFSHLLADSRLKNEASLCPNCRCEISDRCTRNLAVEKILSELPSKCSYCFNIHTRKILEQHEKHECIERPTHCVYEIIGCEWCGPFKELSNHVKQCAQPSKECRHIITHLSERNAKLNEQQNLMLTLINKLSYEKNIVILDVQLKQCYTDEEIPKLYFETNRFSAFSCQWTLKAIVNDNAKNPNLSFNRYLSYKLLFKSKQSTLSSSSRLNSPLNVKFCVLNRLSEAHIIPQMQSFEFNENKCESDYIQINIKLNDCNKLLISNVINLRLLMVT